MLERLQKIIARAGIASRRHAEELIVSGQVTVNGVVVTELGAKADPEHDHIEAAGRVAEQARAASYYILQQAAARGFRPWPIPKGGPRCGICCAASPAACFRWGGWTTRASGLILLTSDGQLADSIFKVPRPC